MPKVEELGRRVVSAAQRRVTHRMCIEPMAVGYGAATSEQAASMCAAP